MEHVPRVHMTGPLGPYQDALWTELLRRGYPACSAVGLIRVAVHMSKWLSDAHQSGSDLTRLRIQEYLQHRQVCGCKQWITLMGLTPILEPLRALGVVPAAELAPIDGSPAGRLLHGFEKHLLEERGLKTLTAAGYCRVVKPFVDSLCLSDLSELEGLSAEMVSRFILREARSSSVGYLKQKAMRLRALLRYLHLQGFCRDLSAAIPAVACPSLSGLPKKAIPEEEVRHIEACCDRGSAMGRRDYAIVLLLSRLGLRSCEVVALELDDVRWSQGEIIIRGKGSEGLLPLPHEIGEALVDYLKEGRPISTSRRVFLSVLAPHGDLTVCTVWCVVRRACQRAGLPPIGPHRFRHSAATCMLRRGATLPDIAQVLRHRSLETTAIYAKVDHLALRPLGRSWPGGGA